MDPERPMVLDPYPLTHGPSPLSSPGPFRRPRLKSDLSNSNLPFLTFCSNRVFVSTLIPLDTSVRRLLDHLWISPCHPRNHPHRSTVSHISNRLTEPLKI